ncbi:hypothetical protein Ancab_017268 [Ancistrocladus abbreviatus]
MPASKMPRTKWLVNIRESLYGRDVTHKASSYETMGNKVVGTVGNIFIQESTNSSDQTLESLKQTHTSQSDISNGTPEGKKGWLPELNEPYGPLDYTQK